MRQIPREKIQITVEPVEEYITPEEAGKDCAPGYAEAVYEMQRQYNSPWNWCTVKVTAKVPMLEALGVQYLGCCSYKDKKDFIENSGYYEDMVMEAIAQLHDNIYNSVGVLRECGIFDLFADHSQIIKDLEDLADGRDDDLGELLMRAVRALRLQYGDSAFVG